jgi:hypothetical protein
MAWRITEDLIADSGGEKQLPEVGKLKGKVSSFRLLDADGNIYYEGEMDWHGNPFAPLDDFGMPNAGCVELQYCDDTTNGWKVL